jgi:nicotinate-nucleotide adenylyltransferase
MSDAVAIMGGTFDPIHFGHLVAAEEARVRFKLSRVIFVPNGNPPHKKGYQVTPAALRCDMVTLATAGNPWFETSRIEVERPGPSYAVDTVRAFRQQLPPDTTLYFITGADAILEILTWRQPQALAESCEFIAVTRPGCDLRRLQQALSPELLAHTHTLDVPGVDISSTELRRRAACGESLRYLTPQAAARYIDAHRLYRSTDCQNPTRSRPQRACKHTPSRTDSPETALGGR